MSSKLIDADLILSGNEQWMKLDQDWKVVDLEEDEPCKMSPKLSNLDLRLTTFNSSFLLKKVRRNLSQKVSKKSPASTELNYKDFLENLKDDEREDLPLKQFYYISGQILSALSVEEICDKIDDIFRSVDKLCSATSTIRQKRQKPLPDTVQCSFSATGLSFDDSVDEKEKCDDDDVDKYIDEAFNQLNSTIASLENLERSKLQSSVLEESRKESVTSLVMKFTSLLNSPGVNKSPRRKRQCSDRFRDLAEFWRRKTYEI